MNLNNREKIFSVVEYINFVNQLITPQRAVIQGELGQVDKRSAYTFFSLLDKEEQAVLKCFVWQRTLNNFNVDLKEGAELQVEGFANVFKRTGSFNFEVERVGLVGEGALRLAFEKLKKRLEELGFFTLERKKAIPKYPQNIGLITSNFGDAKNDFLAHLDLFGLKIWLYDVRVEGLYAIDDIIQAIKWFNENELDIDVLVLTRGGGSLESLQAFNSESVTKAIFGSQIPIITGIGHENDETIADLVSDFSASTPTHAARVLSDNWRDSTNFILNCQSNITSIFHGQYLEYRKELINFEKNILNTPDQILNLKKQSLDDSQTYLKSQFQRLLLKVKQIQLLFLGNKEKLNSALSSLKNETAYQERSLSHESNRWLKFLTNYVFEIEQRLTLANPESRLKQGYSIVMDYRDKIVKSSQQLKVGDKLNLRFFKGGATSKVEEIQ